jgi:hypothetical protein
VILRVGALAAAVNAERVAGFPSGRLFLDSVEQALAVALVNGYAVRHTRAASVTDRESVVRLSSLELAKGRSFPVIESS